MKRKDTNENSEVGTNEDTEEDTTITSERGTLEEFDSLEDSVTSLEMEQSETGRRTSIFKFYSYKNVGECDYIIYNCAMRRERIRIDKHLGIRFKYHIDDTKSYYFYFIARK